MVKPAEKGGVTLALICVQSPCWERSARYFRVSLRYFGPLRVVFAGI